MCDAEYLYYSDVRDKKRIARGAFNKVNGSKSKKCTFPHELMTRKEIKAMNSKVTSWNLSKFYSWNEFRDMPADLKVEYINKLISDYDISISVIAKELFNISDGYFRKTLIREKVSDDKNVYEMIHLRNGFRTKQESIDAFQTAYLKSLEPPEKTTDTMIDPNNLKIEDVIEEIPSCDSFVNETKPDYFKASMLSSEIHMDGFDIDTISYLASKYIGKKIEVIISVNVVE